MPNKPEHRTTPKPEIRSVHTELRVARTEDGTRTISGLIPYGTESVDLGGFVEVIAQGAFADALQPDADVLALRDHDPKLLLGRTKSHTLTLTDSADELRYSIKLPNTTAANDLAESIDRGDLDSTSFGFVTIDDRWVVTADKVVRTILKVELLEVSPCSFPAYPDSVVSIRTAPAEVRSRITFNTKDGKCDCSCNPCQSDDCDNCSDPDCDDPNCACALDTYTEYDSTRTHMHMVLTLRQRT